MPARITYNSINIDFPREFNQLEQENEAVNALITSGSGIEEQSNYYDRDIIVLSKQLENPTVINQMERFWIDWAKNGSSFEFWRDRNLETYIPFDGQSLNTIDEVAGTLTGGATWQTGKYGGAIYIDTGDKLLYAVNSIDANTKTVSFWFKPSFVYNSHADAMLFQSGTSTANKHMQVLFNSVGNIVTTTYKSNNNTTAASLSFSASGVGQNTWHHYLATIDSSVADGLEVFLDGVSQGTSANASYTASGSNNAFAVGSDLSGGNPALSAIDDLFLRSDILSNTDINHIANSSYAYTAQRNYYSAVKAAQNSFKPERIPGTNRFNIQFAMKEVLS